MSYNKEEILNQALKLAKGSFQEDLILGNVDWSLSNLKGKAKDYKSKYLKSREKLYKRIIDSGLPIRVMEVNNQGKLELVIMDEEEWGMYLLKQMKP